VSICSLYISRPSICIDQIWHDSREPPWGGFRHLKEMHGVEIKPRCLRIISSAEGEHESWGKNWIVKKYGLWKQRDRCWDKRENIKHRSPLVAILIFFVCYKCPLGRQARAALLVIHITSTDRACTPTIYKHLSNVTIPSSLVLLFICWRQEYVIENLSKIGISHCTESKDT
jgi:hypothetical protein